MTQDNGSLDIKNIKRISKQVGLGTGTPCGTVRTVTVPKPRTVERDYPMSPREQFQHSACPEILSCDHVAVEQDDRRSFALLDVMKSDAVDGYKAPGGRMFTFGFPCAVDVVCRHCCQRSRCCGEDCARARSF